MYMGWVKYILSIPGSKNYKFIYNIGMGMMCFSYFLG